MSGTDKPSGAGAALAAITDLGARLDKRLDLLEELIKANHKEHSAQIASLLAAKASKGGKKATEADDETDKKKEGARKYNQLAKGEHQAKVLDALEAAGCKITKNKDGSTDNVSVMQEIIKNIKFVNVVLDLHEKLFSKK